MYQKMIRENDFIREKYYEGNKIIKKYFINRINNNNY